MLHLLGLIVCPALLTIVSFLWWELSKTKSQLRYCTNELMAAKRKKLRVNTPEIFYSVTALKSLPQKELQFEYERLLASGCLRDISLFHSLLKDHNRSRIMELLFLEEITPLLNSSSRQILTLLEKYTVENAEEKMN